MLPQKLFFRIGEVAGLVGVEPHVLRYWEREFRSIRPTKSAKGQRVYSRKDVENLLRVRDLLYRDGFTIAGAKKKLQRGEPTTDAAFESVTAVEEESHAPLPAPSQASVIVEPRSHITPIASEARDGSPPNEREKLLALRNEIEEFLADLSSPSLDDGRGRDDVDVPAARTSLRR